VVGGSSSSAEEDAFAEELGRLLAENGLGIVCGGGSGVMRSVCRGAASAGGLTIGILPTDNTGFANDYIDIAIPTGLGGARNRIVALAGSAVVAIGGRFGTLSEIAYALDAGRPVCCMGNWSGLPGVLPVESPREALSFVLGRLQTGEER
jgi:uncharacterized protein (TIGR00725 family)